VAKQHRTSFPAGSGSLFGPRPRRRTCAGGLRRGAGVLAAEAPQRNTDRQVFWLTAL
jgi:hypothetical protein